MHILLLMTSIFLLFNVALNGDVLGDAMSQKEDSDCMQSQSEHAAVWLSRFVAENPPHTIDILLLGPLTNLVCSLFRACTFILAHTHTHARTHTSQACFKFTHTLTHHFIVLTCFSFSLSRQRRWPSNWIRKSPIAFGLSLSWEVTH